MTNVVVATDSAAWPGAPAAESAPALLPRFLPFFGDTTLLWQRPALNIGGPSSAFNTWLNKGRGAFDVPDAPSPGIHYAPGDTVTAAGGTFTSPTVITITNTTLVSAAIVSPGSGGMPGSAQVVGTTGTASQLFILNVTIGMGGSISSIDSIATAGNYTGNPTMLSDEPVGDQSGSGIVGAAVSVVMGVFNGTQSIARPGQYSVLPSNPVSQSATSGAGSGATFDLTYGSVSSATDNSQGQPLIVGVTSLNGSGNSNTFFLSAILKPALAAPWSVTVGAALLSGATAQAVTGLPLVLYNQAADKAVAIAWENTTAGVWHYHPTAGISIVSVPVTIVLAPTYFMWFRITNDGTTLRYYLSYEGLLYIQFSSESATGFVSSFDFYGFGVDSQDYLSTGDQAQIALWNWVETSP